jgi:hypothetical protein
MKRTTSLLIALLLFVLLNTIPWTLRQTERRSGGKRGVIGHLGINRRAGGTEGLVPLSLEDSRAKNRLEMLSRDAGTRTLAELMREVNYSVKRVGKACDVLADNVTIDMDDPFRIGVVNEVVGKQQQRIKSDESSTTTNTSSSNSSDRFAYVLMVSNHKYIDGAIVVADSLRSHSVLVQQGKCDVVLIVPEKINVVVLELLSVVFSRVLIVRSVDQFSPKSYYKTTFDKMYLYSLHEYQSVIFFDADSLIIGNPDKLFQKVSAVHPLTAVGGNDYFQTALLIVKPSREVFLDLYLEYRYGAFGYNQWRARDGILFRNCLMMMHDNIGHPVNSVFHFYGYIKPWFNKDIPYKSSKEKLTFDRQYLTWWERYESLHTRYFADFAIRDRLDPQSATNAGASYTYGETALIKKKAKGFLPLGVGSFDDLADVSPREYMWLQRFSGGSEYHRPTFRKYAELRNASRLSTQAGGDREDVQVVVSQKASISCDEVCKQTSTDSVCVERLLSHSMLNDCKFVRNGRLGSSICSSCSFLFDSNAAPFVRGKWTEGDLLGPDGRPGITVVGGAECFMNFLHEPLNMPVCNATAPGARRVCPCSRGVH